MTAALAAILSAYPAAALASPPNPVDLPPWGLVMSATPNPTAGHVSVSFEIPIGYQPGPLGWTLYDVRGRVAATLYEGQTFGAGSHTLPLEIPRGVQPGVYFLAMVRVTGSDNPWTPKQEPRTLELLRVRRLVLVR